MSNKYWPKELAQTIASGTRSFKHPLLTMKDSAIGEYISSAMANVGIEAFVGKIDIQTIEMEHDEAAKSQVEATIRIEDHDDD